MKKERKLWEKCQQQLHIMSKSDAIPVRGVGVG